MDEIILIPVHDPNTSLHERETIEFLLMNLVNTSLLVIAQVIINWPRKVISRVIYQSPTFWPSRMAMSLIRASQNELNPKARRRTVRGKEGEDKRLETTRRMGTTIAIE